MDSKKIDTGVGLGLAVLSAAIYFSAEQYSAMGVNSYGPNFFPQLLSVLLFICSGALVFKAIRGTEESELEGFDTSGLIKVGITFAIAVLYIYAMQFVGFYVASALFLYSIMFVLGKRNHLMTIAISVVIAAIVWFIFAYLLMIPVPYGIFEGTFE